MSSGIDFTNVIDPDFPPINREAVTPSVSEVALLCRTRTVDNTGAEQATFTPNTRPKYVEVENLIRMAVSQCLVDLPDYVAESYYPRIKEAVVLKAASLIELSFFREQYNQGSAQAYDTMYDKLIASIEMIEGGSGSGRRVDSVMGRSTMVEYDPDYPMPPPRVIVRPVPIDGNPLDEVAP